MKTAAIVAEYNPFHKGHEYQIAETRKAGATHVVAVMSGNFVQRGEPAVYDKFLRAKAALECGADLVVELPLPWAMSGAQSFARGAVSIAKALGCVDMLSFGCEIGNFEKLKELAETIYSADFQNKVSNFVKGKDSFAQARQAAAASLCGEETASLLSEPNNILAVEYIAAAKLFKCQFEFNAVARMGDGYNAFAHSGKGFASATAIREQIKNNKLDLSLVPDCLNEVYTSDFADISRLDSALLYSLRRLTVDDIKNAPDISEGLENYIYSAVQKAKTVSQLFDLLKTKRYTHARLRRIIMSLFLGLTAEHTKGLPPYIRLLACSDRGREILSCAKPALPVIGRALQAKSLEGRGKEIFELECKADDIFALCFSPARECGESFRQKLN